VSLLWFIFLDELGEIPNYGGQSIHDSVSSQSEEAAGSKLASPVVVVGIADGKLCEQPHVISLDIVII